MRVIEEIRPATPHGVGLALIHLDVDITDARNKPLRPGAAEPLNLGSIGYQIRLSGKKKILLHNRRSPKSFGLKSATEVRAYWSARQSDAPLRLCVKFMVHGHIPPTARKNRIKTQRREDCVLDRRGLVGAAREEPHQTTFVARHKSLLRMNLQNCPRI